MTHRSTRAPQLSWTQVCARRLDRHALSAPSRDARPADVVEAMCGAHAQVMSAAEVSVSSDRIVAAVSRLLGLEVPAG